MKNGEKRRGIELSTLILAFILLAAWQGAAVSIGKSHILPGPVEILKKTWSLRESLFFHHLPATLKTIAAGWGLAIIIGFTLAVIMYISPAADAMLYPVLVTTQTVPVMCISPLFVLWFGYSLTARLLAVVLSTFFSITLNLLAGFRARSRARYELLKTMGAGRLKIFLSLELPGALPNFLTALKMTFPWAVIDAAVAEWLGATEGLGYFAKRMVSKMDGAAVFAPVLVLCLVSLAGMAVIDLIDRRIFYRRET